MAVGEEADDDQEEDDEEPEDDLHLPVPQAGGGWSQVPGLTAAVGTDWSPAVANPLPLDLRTGGHSVPGVMVWC